MERQHRERFDGGGISRQTVWVGCTCRISVGNCRIFFPFLFFLKILSHQTVEKCPTMPQHLRLSNSYNCRGKYGEYPVTKRHSQKMIRHANSQLWQALQATRQPKDRPWSSLVDFSVFHAWGNWILRRSVTRLQFEIFQVTQSKGTRRLISFRGLAGELWNKHSQFSSNF